MKNLCHYSCLDKVEILRWLLTEWWNHGAWEDLNLICVMEGFQTLVNYLLQVTKNWKKEKSVEDDNENSTHKEEKLLSQLNNSHLCTTWGLVYVHRWYNVVPYFLFLLASWMKPVGWYVFFRWRAGEFFEGELLGDIDGDDPVEFDLLSFDILM